MRSIRMLTRRRRLIRALMPAFMACMLIAGCTPTKYSPEQTAAEIDKGRPYIEAYLENLPEAAEIDHYYMLDGAYEGSSIYAGYYGSHVIGCVFSTAEKQKREVLVNTETGEMWTTYFEPSLKEIISEQLEPYFEKYGFSEDYRLTGTNISYFLQNHDVTVSGKPGETVTVDVWIENALPVELIEDGKVRELKNVPIADLGIIYASDEERAFDPRILQDYLRDYGNFNRTYTDHSYTAANFPGELRYLDRESEMDSRYFDRKDCVTVSFQDNDPENVTFSYVHYAQDNVNGMILQYADRQEILSPGEETPEIIEAAVPYEMNGDCLHYLPDRANVLLYFRTKPSYTRYERSIPADGTPGAYEECVLEYYSNGYYSLSNGSAGCVYGYDLGREQYIRFIK